MTLEENKKITLGLIEEYAPNNQYLTEDEDIRNRLNLVYAPNYQYLSQIKKILKTENIEVIENKDMMTEYDLPEDMYQFKRVIGLNSDNKEIGAEFYIVGKKIYIKQKTGKYIIEYYAYPTDITLETSKDFELEIDRDAQSVLPYLVANDILKVDPSADYTAFYREFQARTETLLSNKSSSPSATVVGGIL